MKAEINRYRYWTVVVIITIIFSISVGYSQTAPGTLKGEVITIGPDGSTINVPGAKIILTDLARITETLSIFADDAGSYKFEQLSPGIYTVETTVEGFVAVKKQISIKSSEILTENIQLDLDGVTANVTISADANDISVTESSVASSLGPRNLQNTPLFEEKFQEALPLIPGVIRGPDGLINVKGASASQSGTLVGSSNGDDPVTGNAAVDLPLEAIESVQVFSNPYSAEFGNFTGGVVQLQTRSGSNKWNFGLTNFFPRLRERGGSIRGIESIKPRLNFGGPLIKDKLFFFQSFEYRFIQTRVESLPDLKSDSKLESFDSFTRIDYNISDTHRLTGTFTLFPQKLDYVNLNTFNPQDTAANFHQRGWMLGLNDQYVTTKGSVWQTTFNVKQTDADVFGNSSEPFTIAPETNSGGYFNRQNRESRRYEAQTIYSAPVVEWGGQHSWKFGGGFGYTTFDGTNINSPVRITRADGTLNQLQTYTGSGVVGRNKTDVGLFVQDKWTINPHLTLDLGVRVDRDSISESFNTAPRFGFVYSPFEDNKTVIRGGVGLFYSKVPLNVGVFTQGQGVIVSRFAADGIMPVSSTLFRNVLVNDEVETPYSVAWNLQFDREITDRISVRAGYEQRESKRGFILDPLTGVAGDEGVYLLSNSGRSSYRELLLMTRLKLQDNRDLFFSYTRSRAVGDLNDFGIFAGNLRNPIIRQNEYSRLSFDAPNRFLFWGEFGLPFGLTFSPVIDWRTGFPYSAVDENQDFVGLRNQAGHFPDFFSADVQVLKDFKVGFRGKEYTLRAGVKFFNVTNHFNPRDVQSNIDSSDFGGFSNGVGRRTRFKFEVVF